MPLKNGKLAGKMKAFILKANQMTQDDAAKATEDFCNEYEKDIYEAIRSITITIPSSYIKVVGSAAAQTNVSPIVLKNAVS